MFIFSILVPVYNRAHFVDTTLSSVLNQTYPHFEIICVNDCSTDNSLELLEEFARKDARIKIIKHEKNLGLYIARKTGVLHASGDYVLFLDCDDRLFPNALEVLEKKLSDTETDVLGFSHITGIWHLLPPSQSEYTLDELIHRPTVWNKAYKTSVLKKAFSNMTEFYAVMAEDSYQTLIISYFAKTYQCIPDVLYFYNDCGGISNQRKTLQAFEKDLVSIKNVLDGFKIFVCKENLNTEYVKKLEAYLCRYMYNVQIFTHAKESELKRCLHLLPKYFSEDAIKPFKRMIKAPGIVPVIVYRVKRTLVFIKKLFPQSFKDKVKKSLRKISKRTT